MVKAQVVVGCRGKAGGIKAAESLDEARTVAGQILGMDIHGYRVKQVYLEERLEIGQELYLGVTIDRSAREPLLMASAMGGIDIEAVPHDRIYMEHVPTVVGIQPYLIRSLLKQLALSQEVGEQIASVVRQVYDLFRKEDAELVEINPLVVTKAGGVVAGDAKLVIDDNAEYRHPEYANLDQDRTPLEQEAHDKGITFIQLDGDIGVIANGAGLTMATLDILGLKGGRGGTFLDLGGTDDPGKVKQAIEAIEGGLKLVVIITERIPFHDCLELMPFARSRSCVVIGPNCPGLASPGQAKMGIMPNQLFREGDAGVISRSGTLTYEIVNALTEAGFGQTTCIGIGGDPIIGTSMVDALAMFQKDRKTKRIVVVGEIGGTAEEEAADFIKRRVTKPVVAYVAGRTAPPGKRMGHAGAIIQGNRGTAESKVKAFEEAGVPVAEYPVGIPKLLAVT